MHSFVTAVCRSLPSVDKRVLRIEMIFSMKTVTLCSLLTVMLVSVPHAECCKCMVLHPQTNFQSADFVFSVKVIEILNGTDQDSETRVNIQEVFKGENDSHGIKKGETVILTAFRYCGIVLETGETYIISGSINGGKLVRAVCGMAIRRSEASDELLESFKTFAEVAGTCEVPFPTRDGTHTTKQCLIDTDNYQVAECQRQHAVCIPIDGRCQWKTSESYQKCLGNVAQNKTQ